MSPNTWNFWSNGRENAGGDAWLDELVANIPNVETIVILFVSPEYSPERIIERIMRQRPLARIFGASASGVLGQGVIERTGVSMLAIPKSELALESVAFREPQSEAGWQDLYDVLNRAQRKLGLADVANPQTEGLVMLFSAGLLASEERVTSRLHLALPDLPLVGGTASDGMRFQQTYIIDDGKIKPACNLALICRSQRPFEVFQHHHFVPTAEELVVTELGGTPRDVVEFNGKPAHSELAKALGIEPAALNVEMASRSPLGVRVHDRWYIRSVMDVNDQRLLFACALEQGAVLSVMQAGDIIGEFETLLYRYKNCLGGVLFNCMGRFFELEGKSLLPDAAVRLGKLPIAGMNSYGEQFMGMHLNHTLTGVIFTPNE